MTDARAAVLLPNFLEFFVLFHLASARFVPAYRLTAGSGGFVVLSSKMAQGTLHYARRLITLWRWTSSRRYRAAAWLHHHLRLLACASA
jgi:hypothetical protein